MRTQVSIKRAAWVRTWCTTCVVAAAAVSPQNVYAKPSVAGTKRPQNVNT